MSAEGRQLGFGSAWAVRAGVVNRNTPPALLLADVAPGDTTTTEANVWNSWWFSFTLVGVNGVAGAGAVTGVSTSSGVDYTVSGVEGLGVVTTPSIATTTTFTVTGVEGVGVITDVTAETVTIVSPTGVSATGAIGTVAAEVVLEVPVTGVEGLGVVTTPTVDIINIIVVSTTGVTGTGLVTIGSTSSSVTYLTAGVTATGAIKTAPAWNWGQVPNPPIGNTWTVLSSEDDAYTVPRVARMTFGTYFCLPTVLDKNGVSYYPSGAPPWNNVSSAPVGGWGTINSGNTPNWGVYAA